MRISDWSSDVCSSDLGRVEARRAALATNAYLPVRRALRRYIVPVYDHVLATEPLTASQWDSIGWAERQGMTDSDRESVGEGKSVSGRVDLGGRRIIKKKKTNTTLPPLKHNLHV